MTHKNVVRIHDLGDIDGMKYFTMSYVEGEDLSSVLVREGHLPVARALEVFRQVVDGLIAAHEKGIVHRDLKPANIMIDGEGNALLMDFGIARSSGPAAGAPGVTSGIDMSEFEGQEVNLGQTMAGAIVGTLEYIAPEQFRGAVADQRADVYALGLILYDLLLGRRRVKSAKSAIAEVKNRMREPPASPHTVDETIPQALDSVVARCLEPLPENRFQTTSELKDALDELDEHGQPLPRFTRRSLVAGGAAALIVVAALASTYFLARGTGVATEPDPMSVLVADFDNQTGEEVFADTLEQAVAIGLEGASFVNIFPRGRARTRGETIRPESKTLDRELAQLVAQSEGVGVVVGGSIAPNGSGYEISLEAFDAVTGETLGEQDRKAGTRDDVLPTVGQLVVRLRRRLGDTVPDAVAAAAEETFTAGSLEAAQNYARAQDLMATGSWQEAVPLYRQALALDPDFGRAYAGLGATFFNLGQAQEAEDFYQRALARIDRMTERERYRTRGGYYLRIGNWEQAVEELQSLVDNYPADEAGMSNLALAHFFAHDFDAALERGRQAVETYPNNVLSRANLALYAMYAGDFETAQTEALAVIEANPAYETAYVALAMAELDSGNLNQARERYAALGSVSARGSSIANLGEADLALFHGDVAVAAELYERGLEADLALDQTSLAGIKQVGLAAARLTMKDGNYAAPLEQALAATKSPRVQFEGAMVHLRAGQSDAARTLADEIGAGSGVDAQAMKHLILGEVALEGGDAPAAIQSFQEARRLVDSWLARYGLGRAYLQIGSFAQAHSELDRCLTRRGEATAIFFDDLPTYHYLPPLHYYLGQALQGLGSEGAAAEYQRFLDIQGESQGNELVADARVRLGTL